MLDVVNGIKPFSVGNEQIREECTKELNWLKDNYKNFFNNKNYEQF